MRNTLKELNMEADVLDFNEAHKSRRSINPMRFSMTKIKQSLRLEDLDNWINQIKYPQSKNYQYPASLQLAEIHRQSCYLQKEKTFTQNVTKCECCQQNIRHKQHNMFTADMYDIMVHDYGISTPLYFSILKLHIIILLILGCSYGVYFCYLTTKICSDDEFWNNLADQIKETRFPNCEVQSKSFILPQEVIVEYLLSKGKHISYLIYTFACYLSVMMTPFMHEIIIRAKQIKYWNYEQLNHIKYHKLTLYIKHLPKKFSEQEILVYIHNALQKENPDYLNGNSLDELVYIYDIHPVKEINLQRQENYIKLLKVSQELKKDIQNMELKGEFIDLIMKLMHQTKQIAAIMKVGLPFTNKVIVKFNNAKVANSVYNHYSKSIFRRIVSSTKAMLGQAQDYKKQQLRLEMSQSMLTDSPSQIDYSAMKESPSQELCLQRSKSVEVVSKDLTKSLAELMEFSQHLDIQLPSQIEDHKDLNIQRGFRQDDIYWENIGMHTIKRFILRIMTTSITLVVGLISMGLFEFLFIEQQSFKKSGEVLKMELYANLLALCIIFLAVFSNIIVVIMTLKSKRSTYSLQERNIITFTTPIQQICIISFPYFLALFVDKGFENITPLYTLFVLARIRIIFKGLIGIFHVRQVSFWSRRRKLIKTFNPLNYFQKELNELMTPSLFPIRSRILYTFFIFSTGLLMMLIGPFILVICIPFQIIFYFYDKYCVLNVYRVDQQFTFELLRYLVKVMQIIMIPIYAYVYIQLLYSGISQGKQHQLNPNYDYYFLYSAYGIFGSLFLMYIFLKKQIANFFVYKILRYTKKYTNKDEIIEKSYFQSYSEYFDKLGVEELSQLLINTFKSMQYHS
ncbi:hypothetical protein pb186bvf_018563 [Paramecium bursaria]